MSTNCPFFSFLALLVLPLWSAAQAPDEGAINATVKKLFNGMAAHDTAAVRACFHPAARLQSVGARFDSTPIDAFIAAIGKMPATTKIEERLLSSEVRQDGDLATVWAPYAFYINGNRSHSGVNAFQLVKIPNRGWLIIQIADTRRK